MGMGTHPDARRRLIALLLARGEIGSAADAAREGVDEAAERDVGVDVEAEPAARFKRGKPVDRAA
jgi:hypothetical protein